MEQRLPKMGTPGQSSGDPGTSAPERAGSFQEGSHGPRSPTPAAQRPPPSLPVTDRSGRLSCFLGTSCLLRGPPPPGPSVPGLLASGSPAPQTLSWPVLLFLLQLSFPFTCSDSARAACLRSGLSHRRPHHEAPGVSNGRPAVFTVAFLTSGPFHACFSTCGQGLTLPPVRSGKDFCKRQLQCLSDTKLL